MPNLNSPQQRAVSTIEGPVLIIAGAGSGKTRVITYRIVAMLDLGIPQSAILALTFTNKAAKEMETRIKEITGKKLQNLTVCTFHAFGVKILREEIEAIGYRKNFSIYDETDRDQRIKDSLRECKISPGNVDVYAIGQLFSKIKTELTDWGDSANSTYKDVYEAYNRGLKLFNAVDFDDLLALPLKIFTEFPEILEKYRKKYRYIMVDEFQDTSFIQYRLMRLLAWREDANQSANICVVGDDDQSIYSWRGASYENIARFERDFPGTVEIKLEQNYRSTTTILEAANGVICNNTNRKEKRLWSGNSGGKPIELFYPQNESNEADFIAGEIKRIRFQEHVKFDDFGVLVRTNSMMRAIEEAFLAGNIPYTVSGGTSFFHRKEIKDVLSYLRVIGNLDDDVNLLRIINTPRRGLGDAVVEKLGKIVETRHCSIWDALETLQNAPNVLFAAEMGRIDIQEFIALIEKHRAEMLSKRNLSQKVRRLVDEIDYWSYLVTEFSKNEKLARWKFANIDTLIDSIHTWESDPDNFDPTLYSYLNRVSLISQNDGDDGDKGKVNLMTIHAAKGLEFPVVFIAGVEDGVIPHTRSLEEGGIETTAGGIEEERRLFYVAITRARDKLFITSCQQRRRQQTTINCLPSPFLAEIPTHLIEIHAPIQKTVEEEKAESAQFFANMKKMFRTNT
ncbi:MAG: UvrD-helicase domain-containing protein [Treponema sp.]|jgi:DNA helicase-2/ATP-dependent DNA helicase PcrA|nr:UvrD-helicase domain-containing protein [Treponema sp.]